MERTPRSAGCGTRDAEGFRPDAVMNSILSLRSPYDAMEPQPNESGSMETPDYFCVTGPVVKPPKLLCSATEVKGATAKPCPLYLPFVVLMKSPRI